MLVLRMRGLANRMPPKKCSFYTHQPVAWAAQVPPGGLGSPEMLNVDAGRSINVFVISLYDEVKLPVEQWKRTDQALVVFQGGFTGQPRDAAAAPPSHKGIEQPDVTVRSAKIVQQTLGHPAQT